MILFQFSQNPASGCNEGDDYQWSAIIGERRFGAADGLPRVIISLTVVGVYVDHSTVHSLKDPYCPNSADDLQGHNSRLASEVIELASSLPVIGKLASRLERTCLWKPSPVHGRGHQRQRCSKSSCYQSLQWHGSPASAPSRVNLRLSPHCSLEHRSWI